MRGAAGLGRLAILLISIDFLDELASGVPFVGAPGIQHEFGLSYTASAGLLLSVIQVVSLVLEPPLFLLADRYPRKWFVCGGLTAMALVWFAAALAPVYAVVLLALACFGPASAAGVSLAQATLMDAHPEQRERMMTRWVLAGSLGDLATPALFGVLAFAALGWRTAFAATGAMALGWALILWRQRFPDEQRDTDPDAEKVPLLKAVRSAFGNPSLMVWLLGAWLCSLLDEILVAFGSLYMRDQLGADLQTRALMLMLFTAGGAIGAAAVERLLARFRPLFLLQTSAGLAVVSYAAWLLAPTLASGAPFFFLTGLFSTPLYAIAKARAYRSLPGGSGMVNAVSSVFMPLDVLLPLLLGIVADRFGLVATLVILGLQPLGLFLLAFLPVARRLPEYSGGEP